MPTGGETKVIPAPSTEEELKLLRIGADIAEEQLAALKSGRAFQEEQFAAVGAQFNEAAYLRANPDVAAVAFDETFYLEQNPTVAAAVKAGEFSSAFDHYQQFGKAEGRDANPTGGVGLFRSGQEHFQLFGLAEGRPSRIFDPSESLINQQIALLQEQVEPTRFLQGLARTEADRATDLSGDLGALRERNLAFLDQPEGFLSRSPVTGPSRNLGLTTSSSPSPKPSTGSINGTGVTSQLGPSIPNILGQPSGFLPPPNGTGTAGLGLAATGVGTQENPAQPRSDEQVQAMPPGTFFIDETGQVRRKR